eukprot:5289684-Alexandrium_andersonii.AAC.1
MEKLLMVVATREASPRTPVADGSAPGAQPSAAIAAVGGGEAGAPQVEAPAEVEPAAELLGAAPPVAAAVAP